MFEVFSLIGTSSVEIERVNTTDHSIQTQREIGLQFSISNAMYMYLINKLLQLY